MSKSRSPHTIVPPGGRIGILGGGQLGRMLALAAAELGLTSHVYCPESSAPAIDVAATATQAAYDDAEALARFASSVDVVTYEFENVPSETARILATHAPVRPGVLALATAQDRIVEKDFITSLRISTAPYSDIPDEATLRIAIKSIGAPAVLKTRRFGYDGKGQANIKTIEDALAAYDTIGRAPAILEGFVPFEREISVIVARALDGSIAAYDPVENQHKHHILDRSLVPARIDSALADEARAIASRIVAALDYVGVMGVEMFVLAEGADGSRLLVNEIAPRVHNSGHWTQDACAISQFAQHIRAICGWPLGPTTRHSDVVMTNLIGDDVNDWRALAADPSVVLHLYGKAEAHTGRKMGHVNRLYPLGQAPQTLR